MLELKHALGELDKVVDIIQLENFFQIYLGKKGLLNEEFKAMLALGSEEKKDRWAKLSELKTKLTEAYDAKEQSFKMAQINEQLEKDPVDISLDTSYKEGSYSLLAKIRRDAEEICKSMGFVIEYGTEMVTKFENFESVNIPLTHPATEMHDTIYLNDKDAKGENLILRTHTSSMQNYLIQKYGLPLKAVVPGKAYRFENMDATHDIMFYQLEWMVIDKNISIAHFKEMITKLLSSLLHKNVETRMRPGYFPFVEPGFEIDVRYDIYNQETGTMEKSKRMEILGAGMIHPNVLKTAGIDVSDWRSGFAFGVGITRLAAVRYGMKDIRYFTNGDLRFAKSFA
jgi:phenylalanyl-tRNA synthetase alpha chain